MMQWYAWCCILIFVIGNAQLIVRLFRAYVYKPVSIKRTQSSYEIPNQSWSLSIRQVLVDPFSRILWKKNPLMVIAHVIYHIGFFGGLATYGVVLIKSANTWTTRGAIFNIPWHLCAGVDQSLMSMPKLHAWFMLSAIFGTVGMAIPYILTIRKKRDHIHSPDPILGISRLPRSAKTISVSIQRKVIGLFVLLMDPMIFLSSVGVARSYPLVQHSIVCIHSTIFWLILASFPYTFLRHEYVRIGTILAIIRRRVNIPA